MTAAPGLRRRGRAAERTPVRHLVTAAVLLDLLLLVGVVAIWPIYRSTAYLIMAGAALVLAHLVALAGLRWRWSVWWLILATFGVYLAFGLPLAAPEMLTGLDRIGQALLGLVTAPVTGWKDLLTLDLPLGAYRTTLAPTFLLLLAATVTALSLAWRARRLWVLAPLVGLVPPVFGVLFGSDRLSGPLSWSAVMLPGPIETAVGAAAVLAALGYVVWRTLHDRRLALRAAEAATGVRTTGRSGSAVAGRIAIAAGMVVAAVAVGAAVTPVALADQDRDVLRARVDPRVQIEQELSPLSQYRAFLSDDLFDTVLFTVDADEPVDRVRLATLSFYDGRVARVMDPADTGDGDAGAFARVPSALPAPDGTVPVDADIAVDGYRGIWTPTVGSLTSISFRGPAAGAVRDGFFYDPATRMGVTVGDTGLSAGVAYTQRGAVEESMPAVSDLRPTHSAGQLDEALVPTSLVDWIRAQQAPAGGEGLAVLIDRLRARGYLSHALADDAGALWRTTLPDYRFESSRAGHSTDRIDALFTALLQRQNDVGGTDDAALVAAIGDDEQFAVAGALIADQLGFSSRVVLGARLVDDGDPDAMPACTDGVCRGANMTAWVEVQDATGVWVPIDVTPQHAVAMSPDELQHRDPEVPTQVRDERAESVLPGEANPADSGQRDSEDAPEVVDLSALWTTLRIAGASVLALVVLAGPFALVVLLKALRRRGRRRSPDPVDRVTGGWQEYVDTAVDHGHAVPHTQTRQELAALYGGTQPDGPAALAVLADRAVFDAAAPTDADGERFWAIVETERRRMAAERTRWQRLRARLSLRSLRRRPTRRKDGARR